MYIKSYTVKSLAKSNVTKYCIKNRFYARNTLRGFHYLKTQIIHERISAFDSKAIECYRQRGSLSRRRNPPRMRDLLFKIRPRKPG